VKRLLCATFEGGATKEVEVEASFLKALPSFSIVGLASNSIQEAKERVKAALLASGFTFPPLKITVNLAPSDIKKSGSHFDLAIALLIALQKEKIEFKDFFVFGELGLDGRVKDTQTIFPMVLDLAKKDIKVLAPKDSCDKLANIPGIELYGIETLQEAIDFFKSGSQSPYPAKSFLSKSLEIEGKEYFYETDYPLDFCDVKGQEHAIRAALIAAAGCHNILLEGTPGAGKSMIAKRLRYILPPMSHKEVLASAKLEALDGKEPTFKAYRAFRSPHHSSTKASIFGGGSRQARMGEVALAHLGILFFDELPHFPKSVLEALREPLQDYRVLVSRVNTKVTYPTRFLFVAAQNPCPCGNLFSRTKECRCTDYEIKRYKA